MLIRGFYLVNGCREDAAPFTPASGVSKARRPMTRQVSFGTELFRSVAI